MVTDWGGKEELAAPPELACRCEPGFWWKHHAPAKGKPILCGMVDVSLHDFQLARVVQAISTHSELIAAIASRQLQQTTDMAAIKRGMECQHLSVVSTGGDELKCLTCGFAVVPNKNPETQGH